MRLLTLLVALHLVILPIMNKLLVTRHYENLGWKVGST